MEALFFSEDIRMFPDAVTSGVHVDAPVKVNISIIGIDSKVIANYTGITEADLGQLAIGVYLIKVFDEQNAVLKVDMLVKTD